jgi:beta-N-acetylhexosaminidase
MSMGKKILASSILLSAFACTSAMTNQPDVSTRAARPDDWVDSVLASLSLRQKAAQIVWPSIYGDYVSGDSPQWRKLAYYIQTEKVGGFTISVGSPTEMASKLNAMQSMSAIPLLFGADLEAGAGFRARGGYFVPNAIDLGGGDRVSSRDGCWRNP